MFRSTGRVVYRPPLWAYPIHLGMWPTIGLWTGLLGLGALLVGELRGTVGTSLGAAAWSLCVVGIVRTMLLRIVITHDMLIVSNPIRTYRIPVDAELIVGFGWAAEMSDGGRGIVVRRRQVRAGVFALEFYRGRRREAVIKALETVTGSAITKHAC